MRPSALGAAIEPVNEDQIDDGRACRGTIEASQPQGSFGRLILVCVPGVPPEGEGTIEE